MELSELAQRVLFEPDLAGKLVLEAELSDEAPRFQGALPDRPARAPHLAFGRGKAPFPGKASLERDEKRAEVLHFFANHELMAMELMALALLKFPDAPKAFRLGVGRTILEEARHLALYVERMGELGLELGALPLSDFFWRAIASMETPLDYAARMSLTLEQANLDYSLHYKNLFDTLGDDRTAAILERVYKEEIGHVRHGVVWFERLRDPSKDLFTAQAEALSMPLSPARAKGLGFDRAGRLAAGLPEDYITKLAVFERSKGRPGSVFLFNPTAEDEVADGVTTKPPRRVAAMIQDFETLPMFLAKQGDAVLVASRPREEWLATWHETGLVLPEWLSKSDSFAKDRRFGALVPWSEAPSAFRWREHLQGALQDASSPTLLEVRSRLSKETILRLRATLAADEELRTLPFGEDRAGLCRAPDEVEARLRALAQEGFGTVVIKGLFACSGRETRRQPSGDRVPADWLARALTRHGAVLVEPWLDRVADLSVLLDTRRPAPYLGWSWFFADGAGRYRGHVIRRGSDTWTPLWFRQAGERAMARIATHAAVILKELGYEGPAGVDLFLYRSQRGLALQASEINARYTMGHVARALARRMPARAGIWLQLTVADAVKAGHQNLSSYAAALAATHPPRIERGVGLEEGILFTNDPHAARERLGVLIATRREALGEHPYVEFRRAMGLPH